MASSSQVYSNVKVMPHRRHHAVPGSPTEHQCVPGQHTRLSSTPAETREEQSTLLQLHMVMKKVWNQIHQCLTLAVSVMLMMWQHFKAQTSLWYKISQQGQSNNKRKLSVNGEVNVLSYCSEKWKGEALCAVQMRKAYEDVYRKYNVKTLLHVKEDNYCVLRAVLFQVFSAGIPFPGWMKEKDILKVPEKLLYSQGCNWIQQFSFGPEKYAGPKVYGKLRRCVEVLKNQWMDFYNCKDRAERKKMCKLLFSDETKENKIYEALKFIMLYLVIEAYENMKNGHHFPHFFHLLFSQDSSSDPLSYMMNHLNSVGDTTGMEQADMCLLGYALEVKLKVIRLRKMNTEGLKTIYPEDYKRDWHEIILMTDDDQHYNIPVIGK